jgi:cell division protein FtsB
MNIKKEVIDRVRAHLWGEQSSLQVKLKLNKREVARLVDEQTILKRQIAKYTEMLKGL